MQRAADLERPAWLALARAFYDLAHGDPGAWDRLPPALQETDVGALCARHLATGDRALVEEAGELLAGKHWYVALGRTF